MNKKHFWPFLFLIPLSIAVIVGWFLLPDTLVMQVSMSGQPSKSMPKVLGLLIPMAAGMIGAAYASSEKEERMWFISLAYRLPHMRFSANSLSSYLTN